MIVLETQRLLFRDHGVDDLEAFCAMEADPEVRRFVGGSPRSRDAAEHKFRTVYLKPIQNRLGLWATVFKPERRYIGYCGIYPHFGARGPIPSEGTLAFYLARSHWQRGLATEAGLAFVEFGFGELGLSRIVASVQVGNAASLRVLKKLKFEFLRLESGRTRSFEHFALRKLTASRTGV